MTRYFIQLQYDGTHFAGWQIQPNAETIQETIEKALFKLNSNQKVNLVGCGRTDAGVHAQYYIAHFDFSKKLKPDDLVFKLNKMLPNDIAILGASIVNNEAHARFDAQKRAYKYFIHHKKNAFLNRYSHYYPGALDVNAMNKACKHLLGTQDFECFSKVKTDVKTFDCTIYDAYWKEDQNGLVFYIEANRFLRNMVRAIVGSMIDIGSGKHEPEYLKTIIASKNRNEAGESVPAGGLFLWDIQYPKDIFM